MGGRLPGVDTSSAHHQCHYHRHQVSHTTGCRLCDQQQFRSRSLCTDSAHSTTPSSEPGGMRCTSSRMSEGGESSGDMPPLILRNTDAADQHPHPHPHPPVASRASPQFREKQTSDGSTTASDSGRCSMADDHVTDHVTDHVADLTASCAMLTVEDPRALTPPVTFTLAESDSRHDHLTPENNDDLDVKVTHKHHTSDDCSSSTSDVRNNNVAQFAAADSGHVTVPQGQGRAVSSDAIRPATANNVTSANGSSSHLRHAPNIFYSSSQDRFVAGEGSRPIVPALPFSPCSSPSGSPRSRRVPTRETRQLSIVDNGGYTQLNQYKLKEDIGKV